MDLKKKTVLVICFILFIAFISGVIWTKAVGKDKNIETDLPESGNSEQKTDTFYDSSETVSLKIIRQENLEDKIIFYLKDETETELCIPCADLIYAENGMVMVYEDCEKRIEFNGDTAVISKRKIASEIPEQFSQISRNQKGE